MQWLPAALDRYRKWPSLGLFASDTNTHAAASFLQHLVGILSIKHSNTKI